MSEMKEIQISEISDEVYQEIAVAAARKRLTIPMYTLLAARIIAERDDAMFAESQAGVRSER